MPMNKRPLDYLCVLRWKAAERRALARLSGTHRRRMVPLIEPTPRAIGRAAESPEGLAHALRELVLQVQQSWLGLPSLLDLSHLRRLPSCSCQAAITTVLLESTIRNMQVFPVFALNERPELVRAILACRDYVVHGVGIRAMAEDLASLDGRLRLQSKLQAFGLSPNEVHLIVDQGFVCNDIPPIEALIQVPFLPDWRELFLLGGSFPKDLTELPLGVHRLPRYEWRRYLELVAEWPRATRCPKYGDYGIQHALFEEPPIGARPSASVRYSLDPDWLVLRGAAVGNKSRGGFGQYRGHAKYLVGHGDFRGSNFSAGDAQIALHAQAGARSGSPETWLEIGTSHHFAQALASLDSIGQQTSSRAVVLNQRASADHPVAPPSPKQPHGTA